MSTTTGLSRLYGRLRPRERLALYLAAEARGDQAEQHRLAREAPVWVSRLPDCRHGALAAHLLTLIYVTEQLEHLAAFWHAAWRLDDPDDDCPDDWRLASDVAAYLFACNAKAWRAFCAGLGLDPDQLIAGNYRGDMLHYLGAGLEAFAPGRDELAAHFHEQGVEADALVTAESLAEAWRDLFEQCAGRTVPKGDGP